MISQIRDFEELESLTEIQLIALESLLKGETHQQAAEAAGRSLRWVSSLVNNNPYFQKAYSDAIRTRQLAIQTRAISAATTVFDSLEAIAADTSHRNCLKACELLLQMCEGC